MILSYLVCAATFSPVQADAASLLAAAVDESSPQARASAARSLAQFKSISLEQWLEAARDFAPRTEALGHGTHIEEIELWDGQSLIPGEVVLHVPESYDHGSPTPLILAMHGTGGSGTWMTSFWRELAEEQGCLLLCPSDPGPNVGFAATDVERWTTLSALRWARRVGNVDENAIFLTGFSRGGHMTWDLALRYPDRWAAICPMVGGPRFELARGANNFRYYENLFYLPLVCMQGEQDQAGLVWSVKEMFARLEKAKVEQATLHLFPELGHNVDMGAVDWGAFFALRRTPVPDRLVRSFAREGEGRNAWIEVTEATSKIEEIFTPRMTQSMANKLGNEGLQRIIIDAAIKKTGQVKGRFRAPGQFELRTEKLKTARLLLDSSMLPAEGKKAVVKLGSLKKRFAVEPQSAVLLSEFVERFDRSFLPVAELTIALGR